MVERERLSDTRQSVVHKFNVAGHEGYLILGFYPDGRPGELFLKMSKKGSTVGGLCNAIGVLASLGLQHDIPLEILAKKLEGMKFDPMGETGNKKFPKATSILDYVFRWVIDYCEEKETV